MLGWAGLAVGLPAWSCMDLSFFLFAGTWFYFFFGGWDRYLDYWDLNLDLKKKNDFKKS